MRISTSLLAALATATGIAAQIPTDQNNEHANYQTNTSYTTRSGVAGQSDGWIVNKTNAAWARGTAQFYEGGNGLVGRARGLRYVIQDQGGSTQEQFGIGLFLENPAAPGTPLLPDSTGAVAAGVAFTGINTPSSTNTGAVAWIFTSTFADFDQVPANGDVYCGVLVPANQNWVQDGVSFHAPFFTAGNSGDNPSSGAINGSAIPDTVFSNDLTADPTGAALNSPLADRIQRMHILGPGAALRVGADIDPSFARGAANPNYGFGGLFPDHVARADGLAFKLEDQNLNGITATYGIVGSTSAITGSALGSFGLPLSFGSLNGGDLWVEFSALLPIDWYFGLGASQAGGVVDQIVLPFGTLPTQALGQLAFQGVVFGLDPATGLPFLKATNAIAFQSI